MTLKQNNICISQLFRHIHQIQQTRLVLMKAKAALGEGMSNSRNSRWTKVANGGNKNYILTVSADASDRRQLSFPRQEQFIHT